MTNKARMIFINHVLSISFWFLAVLRVRRFILRRQLETEKEDKDLIDTEVGTWPLAELLH